MSLKMGWKWPKNGYRDSEQPLVSKQNSHTCNVSGNFDEPRTTLMLHSAYDKNMEQQYFVKLVVSISYFQHSHSIVDINHLVTMVVSLQY